MTKAEKFIQDYTNHCSNELEGGGYHEWLTPEQARGAVEIARDEMLKEFEKQGEQKSAWSEVDEDKFQTLLEIVADAETVHCIGGGFIHPKDSYKKELSDFLNSLKDRVQPQPQQEWSGEDETGLSDALWAIEQA
jgi:hypothetical protein